MACEFCRGQVEKIVQTTALEYPQIWQLYSNMDVLSCMTNISSYVVIPGLPLELSLDDIIPGSGLHLDIFIHQGFGNYQDSILVICLHFIVGT